ncbi:neck protein [uncultured Caudovirales phage]|uniref:Neck protein n=1 Tax=uncultured Caudovirales phage TaxID=2100421 RepID=A0A6J7WZ01_9CAUD|nr:neck protein [uncultured Caudovirales phage]
MATSVFFNNFGASMEQGLIEDLIIESIKIYGIDVYYIQRTKNNRDDVFREASYFTYGTAILVDMYIKNVNGFEGDGEFLSKFGIEVRDQITFTVAKRTFANEVGDYNLEVRPLEGDLIWFPLTQTLYQIKLADVKPIFYQLGALQTYDLTCELYEAESAEFTTGIPAIDEMYNAFSLAADAFDILTENGLVLITEAQETIILENYNVEDIDTQAENEIFEQEGLDFIDFTEFDPFSEKGVRA